MWFGDIVTMKWWDDLWLNESFAEYMSHRCLVDATEYTDAWVDSSIVRKVWGYGAERSPSTHPVAGRRGPRRAERAAELRRHLVCQGRGHAAPAHRVRRRRPVHRRRPRLPDRQVLRQRHARRLPRRDRDRERQGPRGVVAGVAADGRPRHDLGRRRGAGAASSSARSCAASRRRTDPPTGRTPSTSPAGPTGASSAGSARRSPGPETTLAELEGTPEPAVLVPNASDLTWARVRLSDSTVAALPAQLAQIPDGRPAPSCGPRSSTACTVRRPRPRRSSRCSTRRGRTRRTPRS